MAKTMKFFERMLTVFLARQNPDSTSAKPRFMKNTRDAVSTTQMVSSATVSSSAVFACAFGGKGDGADDHTGHVECLKLA